MAVRACSRSPVRKEGAAYDNARSRLHGSLGEVSYSGSDPAPLTTVRGYYLLSKEKSGQFLPVLLLYHLSYNRIRAPIPQTSFGGACLLRTEVFSPQSRTSCLFLPSGFALVVCGLCVLACPKSVKRCREPAHLNHAPNNELQRIAR